MKKLSPGRVIVIGFAMVILMGAILLYLPITANKDVEVSIIDALFTSTSAVCVTGLVVVDTADTFNVFGQTIIASFNNAGFDNLGGFVNLASYKENVLLNLTTSGLIIFGGLGFFVVRDIFTKKNYKKFNLNSKITITMTLALLLLGTLLLKITEGLPWLGAFFYSTSTRTAGFSTYPISDFSEAGLFVIIMLMFVGASPASTGGGIKTTTFFALILSVFSFATNRDRVVFKRKLPN